MSPSNEFENFEKIQKNFLNGKISQFIDVYIRQNKVWSAEQIHSEFLEKINSELKNGDHLIDPKYEHLVSEENKQVVEKKILALNWLTTENGKILTINLFNRKIQNTKVIADRKSPIVDRMSFGLKWDKNLFFEINYGRKSKYSYLESKELEKLSINPWTIKHVNLELAEKYNCNILNCLEKLSTSYLENKFVQYWKQNYYFEDKPAIIPEVCGLSSKFYYFTHKDNIYSQKSEILEEITERVYIVNFRYDFLIVNFKTQKIAFIELDGFENHKNRKHQTIDSIKRNNASKNKIVLFTFTSKRINEDIKSVFNELEAFLE
ncbi:MAG: hypothetical protein B7Y83_04860 [Flavobacteriales bacterium 32-34-25]|nr:MAG: hypothetical protein B7Y83_04860 [Flavobacteriales bacterium 32-34-25]